MYKLLRQRDYAGANHRDSQFQRILEEQRDVTTTGVFGVTKCNVTLSHINNQPICKSCKALIPANFAVRLFILNKFRNVDPWKAKRERGWSEYFHNSWVSVCYHTLFLHAHTAVHRSTIFVSNLPYTATSTDLKTLFSDLGPVRTAFVVTDPASGSSKGVGYVSFSIREDANLAFEKVNDTSEGLVLDGRRLRAQWAENKVILS